MKKIYLSAVLILSVTIQLQAASHNEMATRFKSPINEDRPWVYWYWLNGNINEKGLIADLEAMYQAGIGTAMAFDIGIGVQGKVMVRSKEWYELMRKVILKADNLGMRIGFNCPGWANAGGPWITPETSMKELTWREITVTAPNKNSAKREPIKLPSPPSRMGYYKDIAVLAFPTTNGDAFSLTSDNCALTDTSGNRIDANTDKLFDNNRDTYERLPGTFEIVLNQPQTIQSFQVRTSAHADSRFFVMDLWVFDQEQGKFKLVQGIEGSASGLNDRPGMGTASFEPITAQRFRLGFKRGYGNRSTYSEDIYIQEINLQGGYRIPLWHNKTGFGHHEFKDQQLSPKANDIVQSDKIINITNYLREDGTLDWQPDAGNWTIVRLGYIPTGAMSQPLNRGLNSLECDKYSPVAAKIQYDSLMAPLFNLVGRDVAKRVFSNYHVDSYEVGWQNWSEVLPGEFAKRRGYDINKYLLALTGRAINSEAETNAFLWDFRRTMADCYADNHIGYFTQRANEDGMIFSIEAYDGPFEDLQTAGRTNMPMSEIWQGNDPNSRPRSASMFAAHTYGLNFVGSEQYTGPGKWDLHPWKMKNLADASMAYGVNTFVMHVFTQQPWTDPRFTPGATLGSWGAHYDRANTWWKESRGWHDYLARCQYMLRQGQPVADILYYLGDNAPGGGGNTPVNPPAGYEGDAFNQEVLFMLEVENGEFVLPSGKRYKYIVMPRHGEMTLKSLQKIESLTKAGGTIIGTKPIKSRTMADAGRAMEFDALASKIFSNANYGKGRVFVGKNIEDVISFDKLTPDFTYATDSRLNLKYHHRQSDQYNIYYITNVTEVESGNAVCRFRVGEDLVPQLWMPISGDIQDVVSYSYSNGQLSIPMHFEVGQTKFIVFRKAPKPKSNITGIRLDGKSIPLRSTGALEFDITKRDGLYTMHTNTAGMYEVVLDNQEARKIKVRKSGSTTDLSRDWTVAFESRLLSPKLNEPITNPRYTQVAFNTLTDWSKDPREGIKYYSGTAIYTKKFQLKNLNKSSKYEIDLGDVQVIARVFVNGNNVGCLWKPPYRTDISKYIGKGDNTITVEITNTWPNRLIGDEQYPDDVSADGNWFGGELWAYPEWVWNEGDRKETRRVSFTTYKHWGKDGKLFPAGMIGPVKIIESKTVRF